MAYVDIVTALAVLQFFVFAFKVGGARGRYGVKAPAITGNEIFERHFRVQQNTLELLIALVPGLYLIGREVYAAGYVKEPAKRGAGYGLSFLPAVILVVGGLAGAVRKLIAH